MRLQVYETGPRDAAPVVLLHGLFGRAQTLGLVARRLAASHRVIALDLRNHGQSAHAPGMDYRILAGDVLETLGAIDAPPAAIIGHSMGGKTAMAACLMAPAQFTGLLVADIAPRAYQHGNAAVAAAMLALPIDGGLTRSAAMAALEPAAPLASVRQFLLQNFSFVAPQGWRIGLAHIASGIPDLESWPDFADAVFDGVCSFVYGGASDYVTEADWPLIRRYFPRATFVPLEGAGHWLHADRPDEFLAACEAFLTMAYPN